MTKVMARFGLQSPLSETLLARLADARGVYGVLRFDLDDEKQSLGVEYDASRLSVRDVTAILRRAGIPVVPE